MALVEQKNVNTTDRVLIEYTPEKLELVKNTIAKGATNDELQMFVTLSKTYALDPFLKEIMFIKWFNATKQQNESYIYTSHAGYLKIANSNPDHEGIVSFVVRSEDEFSIETDQQTGWVKVSHKMRMKGEINGAWARCDRKGRKPAIAFAKFDEYNKEKNPIWKSNPSAMICKCAELIVLRRQYAINGLYAEEELPIPVETKKIGPEPTAIKVHATSEPPTKITDAEIIPKSSIVQEVTKTIEEKPINEPKKTESPKVKKTTKTTKKNLFADDIELTAEPEIQQLDSNEIFTEAEIKEIDAALQENEEEARLVKAYEDEFLMGNDWFASKSCNFGNDYVVKVLFKVIEEGIPEKAEEIKNALMVFNRPVKTWHLPRIFKMLEKMLSIETTKAIILQLENKMMKICQTIMIHETLYNEFPIKEELFNGKLNALFPGCYDWATSFLISRKKIRITGDMIFKVEA